MSNQHRKPVMAFIVLVVLAAAVISLQMRASANSAPRGAEGIRHSSAEQPAHHR